jgi:RimJ/RimL family protein N-acetyltransferase
MASSPNPRDTARLTFQEWHEGDFELAKELWGDGRVTRMFDRRDHLDDAAVAERLARELRNSAVHGVQYWRIHTRAEPSEFVGVCGLKPPWFVPSASAATATVRCFEVGAHLRPQFWRSGFAPEATAEVLRHAFEELGAAEVYAGHHPQHEGSRKVLTRLGFAYLRDQPFEPTGLNHPIYCMTRSLWQTLKSGTGKPL